MWTFFCLLLENKRVQYVKHTFKQAFEQTTIKAGKQSSRKAGTQEFKKSCSEQEDKKLVKQDVRVHNRKQNIQNRKEPKIIKFDIVKQE